MYLSRNNCVDILLQSYLKSKFEPKFGEVQKATNERIHFSYRS